MHRRAGATLLEVLITVGVWALLMVAMFVIIQIGSQSYQTVQNKNDVQSSIRSFESDINQELQRASASTVSIYTSTADYRWAIWFQTPMDDVDHTQDPAPYKLGDPETVISSGGKPVQQRWELYYVGFMNQAEHDGLYGAICPAIAGGAVGPDLTCPHKWIIKKDIYLNEARNSGPPDTLDATAATDGKLARFLTDHETQLQLINEAEGGSNAIKSATTGLALVHRVQVVAQNVLSFELARLSTDSANPMGRPTPSANGPIILFDVKMFKADAERHVSITGNLATSSGVAANGSGVNTMVDPSDATQTVSGVTVNPKYLPYTIQVDNRVIPTSP